MMMAATVLEMRMVVKAMKMMMTMMVAMMVAMAMAMERMMVTVAVAMMKIEMWLGSVSTKHQIFVVYIKVR